MASKRGGLEDLDLSSDEIKRLTNALKNEEFRKLFAEYAEEISDPENRRRYEEEIAQLESERGMDITFVNPDPGYVIKTTVNGDQKAFINICKNEHIEKPQMTKEVGPNGKMRVGWQIPHSFSPPRDDLDKEGKKCTVYDVVFNPDAYRMAESNVSFKKMIQDTAFDGIEKQFEVKVDRKNLKYPKLKFKGVPVATVIRKRKDDNASVEEDQSSSKSEAKDTTDNPFSNMPYPYDNKTTEEKRKEREDEISKRDAKRAETESKTKLIKEISKEDPDAPATPKYHIIHRSDLDLGEYRNAPDAKTSTRPKELAVVVTLPLLKSAANIDLEIFEKRMLLESETPARYKLDLNLPYPVDENKGSAKFDKTKRQLIITLPVLPAETPKLPSFIDADTSEEKASMENGDLTSESAVNAKPLVEVISSSESENPSDVASETTTTTTTSNSGTVGKHSVKLQIPYSFPEFDIFQDESTVSIIINVRKVDKTSCKPSITETSCSVQMTSIGSGGFPNHYSVYLSFPDQHSLDRDKCTVDIGESNIVLLLRKSKHCQGLWQTYSVGLDKDHLEVKSFVTEKNFEKELRDMKANSTETMQQQATPDMEVTEMNDQKVTLEIKANGGPVNPGAFSRQSPDVEIEDPSGSAAENIEVVFEKELPKLHSILKQRSTSESGSDKQRHASGDSGHHRVRSTSESSNGKQRTISESSTDDLSASLSASHNSESFQSNSNSDSGEDGDHHRLKKSVSFSEDVDSVHYKSGAAISAFHNTLKNKKRRARKREQKQESRKGRRRRNSSNSEYSSSSDKEEGDQHQHSSEGEQTENGKQKESSVEEIFDHRGQGVGQGEGHVDAAITEMMQAQQNSAIRDVTIPKSPENDELMTKQQSITPNGSLETSNRCIKENGKTASDKVDRLKVKVTHSQGHDSDDNDDDPQELDQEDLSPNDPDDKVETVLSWEEPRKDPSLEKTKCAFDFTNSMMYDLDD